MKKQDNAKKRTDQGRTTEATNPAAEAWRRLQAETLLRRCGFIEGADGRWYDPSDPADKGLRLA